LCRLGRRGEKDGTTAASLKAWKAKAAKDCNLVFPTGGCRPKLDFLDCLKAVAARVKLKADGFWLHKFRATFATRCLWNGVDLRTVQQWLGHKDLESTMRYLKPSRSQQTRRMRFSRSCAGYRRPGIDEGSGVQARQIAL
jgi:integrase